MLIEINVIISIKIILNNFVESEISRDDSPAVSGGTCDAIASADVLWAYYCGWAT